MRSSVSRRGVRGAKRIDESSMRAMFSRMQPMTTSLGIVRKFPGEASHFEIDIDPDSGAKTVYVDVELIPNSERVLCKLGFGQDQIFKIPRVDQEVAVLIPSDNNSMIKDNLDNGPIIVGILESTVPDALDGDDVVVITAPRVIMLSDTIQLGANAVALATKEDVQNVADDLSLHEHLYIPYPSGVAGTPVPTTGGPSVTSPQGTSRVTGE